MNAAPVPNGTLREVCETTGKSGRSELWEWIKLHADPDPTIIKQLIETGRAEVER